MPPRVSSSCWDKQDFAPWLGSNRCAAEAALCIALERQTWHVHTSGNQLHADGLVSSSGPNQSIFYAPQYKHSWTGALVLQGFNHLPNQEARDMDKLWMSEEMLNCVPLPAVTLAEARLWLLKPIK